MSNNIEDDLPFEAPNYQENNIKKLTMIRELLDKETNQDFQIEVSDLLDSIAILLSQKANKFEFKTDFKRMQELVEYLDEYYFIPVYGKWDEVDNKYATKIARVIKEYLKNGIVREIEIIKSKDRKINFKITGFGDYNKVILEKDFGNDGTLIYFTVKK